MDADQPLSAPWMLRTEARSIQRYIVSTNRLVEIIGASALVEQMHGLASSLAAELGGVTLTAAAGAVTLGFTTPEACLRFAEWWPLVCARHAPGLHVTQAWVGPTGDDHRLPTLRAGLDAAAQRIAPDLPQAGPMVARAGRTGRAALRRGERTGRKDWTDRETLAKLRDETADPLGDTLLGPAVGQWSFTRQSQVLGEDGLAVVHIDGDGIGQRTLKMSDAQYVAFSRALACAMRAAAVAGVARLIDAETARLKRAGRTPAPGQALPARPVVLGGDDFTIIVSAPDALAFVEAFLTTLKAEGLTPAFKDDGGLTATAGVAIVHDHAPFYEAHRLARELCEAAKTCKLAEEDPKSSLLFHRVTTSAIPAWSAVLTGELEGGRKETLPDGLAGGPYHLAGSRCLADLLELAQALGKLPRGPVREWARLAMRDPNRAALRWKRLRQVAEGRDAWAPIEAALLKLDVDPDTGLYKDNTATPVLDAHTLARLTPGRAGGAS